LLFVAIWNLIISWSLCLFHSNWRMQFRSKKKNPFTFGKKYLSVTFCRTPCIYVHIDANVPYVARIQRAVCSPDLISSLHRHFRQSRPPISAGVHARAMRGFRDECVALEEVGVHDERRTPVERDLRTRPYLSEAQMSTVSVPCCVN